MKKLLRIIVVLLLLMITASVVFTQTRIFVPHLHKIMGQATAQAPIIPDGKQVSQISTHADIPVAVASPAALNALGTDASPMVVKLAGVPRSEDVMADHEKDRETARSLEHYTARIAATALAQNFLMLLQSALFLLILIVLYKIAENLKVIANAALKSAEAAEKAAARKPGVYNELRTKLPPHHYRKR